MKPTQTHTPGPWHPNGSQVTANGDWKAPVCVVVSKEDVRPTVDAAARTLAEARANARLIAAAPDLLAALKLAATMQEPADKIERMIWSGHMATIRAAIARATGQA